MVAATALLLCAQSTISGEKVLAEIFDRSNRLMWVLSRVSARLENLGDRATAPRVVLSGRRGSEWYRWDADASGPLTRVADDGSAEIILTFEDRIARILRSFPRKNYDQTTSFKTRIGRGYQLNLYESGPVLSFHADDPVVLAGDRIESRTANVGLRLRYATFRTQPDPASGVAPSEIRLVIEPSGLILRAEGTTIHEQGQSTYAYSCSREITDAELFTINVDELHDWTIRDYRKAN